MAIPDAFLDELRERVGLAEVVGRRARLTRRGRELVGLCPFHTEKTPSFTVNEAKGFYHCFGCGAHGGAIDFVMNIDGLGFRDAVERLAADVGLEIPPDSPADRERAARRRTLVEVTEAAAAYFEKMLRMPEGRDGLGYLQRRGLDDDTIRHFRLGWAPDTRGALKAALARDGISEAAMIEAGLLVVPEDDERSTYDRFRGRVMFPIADRRGRIIAFGGRILGAGEPKYLNSPETPLFHKGRTLYGLDRASAAARDAGAVVVVEGYMDVIALHVAGYPRTVAPLGTALTEDQITELWRLAPEPVLLFDSDNAGRRAAVRAVERALPLCKSGFGLRFAFIETGTGDDPDGVVRRYPRPFIDGALAGALSVSEMLFWMETQGRRLDTPEERAALETRLRRHAERIGDPALRRSVFDAIRERLRQQRRSGYGRGRETEAARRSLPGVRPSQRGPDEAERQREAILIAVLVTHPEAFDVVGERLGALTFSSAELDLLRQEALFHLSSHPDLDSTGLQSHLQGCGFSELLDSVLGPEIVSDAFFAKSGVALDTAISGWEETYTRHRRRSLRNELDERKRELVDGLSAEAFERFVSLKHQENEGSG